MKKNDVYAGFEQGPIRPPSEAGSLLIRITRNCPWNRCTFCPVYKGTRFSVRPVAHVLRDIDAVAENVRRLQDREAASGRLLPSQLKQAAAPPGPGDLPAFQAALHWHAGGMQSIFLQDANSLILKPADLIRILAHLRSRFPWVAADHLLRPLPHHCAHQRRRPGRDPRGRAQPDSHRPRVRRGRGVEAGPQGGRPRNAHHRPAAR